MHLTAPHYLPVGEHCTHGETETLDLNTPKNSLFLFNKNALKEIGNKIVIRAKLCMTKTHKNMDSHLYKNVHDENPYKNNMNSHSYIDVHDENP